MRELAHPASAPVSWVPSLKGPPLQGKTYLSELHTNLGGAVEVEVVVVVVVVVVVAIAVVKRFPKLPARQRIRHPLG